MQEKKTLKCSIKLKYLVKEMVTTLNHLCSVT